MAAKRTIAELEARRLEMAAEYQALLEEIAQRAGEEDRDIRAASAKAAAKK